MMPKYVLIGPFGVSNSVKSGPMSTCVAGSEAVREPRRCGGVDGQDRERGRKGERETNSDG